jgi:hypothetical protein
LYRTELHGDSRDPADDEVDPENLAPEARGVVIERILYLQILLFNTTISRPGPAELREPIMKM